MKLKNYIAAAAGVGAAAAGALLADGYRYVFCRHYLPVTDKLLGKKGHEEEYYRRCAELKAYMSTRPCTAYTRSSDSGKKLCAWYYRAGEHHSPVVVFIVHGYRGEHTDACAPFYDYYMSRGVDIFTCDHPAHGESGGEMISYGVNEARECLAWLDLLIKERGSGVKIILHGFSMGASAVMLMSDRCPPNVRLIVEDSGYTSAEELLRGELGSFYGPYTKLNRLIGGIDIGLMDVRPHISRTSIPFLFVHGRDDRLVPFDMAPELYMLCSSTEKDRLYTEDARHLESIHKAAAEYTAMLDDCLRKYLTD